jgi:hypothetical protein
VSGYGLDGRMIEVRSLVETRDFSSSLCVQTGSGARPASCTMGTGVSFSGDKARPGRDADLSPPSTVRSWVGAISPLHPSAFVACSGTALVVVKLHNAAIFSLPGKMHSVDVGQNAILQQLVQISLTFIFEHILWRCHFDKQLAISFSEILPGGIFSPWVQRQNYSWPDGRKKLDHPDLKFCISIWKNETGTNIQCGK